VKFSSLYDKRWREDVLWEAGRQGKANRGAPGVEGESREAMASSGQAGAMIRRLRRERRAHTDRFDPVRRVAIPKPQGGTRPVGRATGEDRVVQTAMQLGLEPSCAADCHDGSYGYRPKRDATQASRASREDRYQRAWGGWQWLFTATLRRARRTSSGCGSVSGWAMAVC
jgi:RNA-directed DNA polymerase